MPTITYHRPFIYPYQKDILDSKARYTVCEAATKVGKTASHIIWLFEQALICKEGQSVWWVAPSVTQAKIAYDRMKLQITNKDLFKSNETNRTITLITGGKLEFKTAENPDALYGDDVYAAVFDEFTRARETAWFALRSTLTSTGAKCKFIGNVKGKKNWGYRLGQRAKQGEEGYEYFKITAYDAADCGMMTKDGRPFADEIEEAKRDLPENVFRELYLAEPSEDGSNPFGYAQIQQCTFPISTLPPVCFGIDLAKSFDYAVIIGLDKHQNVCYFDRWQSDWRTTVQKILDLPNVPMAIDSTGVGDPIGEEIAKTKSVVLFKFTSQSKQQIMEGLAVQIQQRKLTFPEGYIKDELEQFEYEYTRTGVKYSAPVGLHDDCVCALALAVHKYRDAGGFGNYSLI